jgi:hypothetical protein
LLCCPVPRSTRNEPAERLVASLHWVLIALIAIAITLATETARADEIAIREARLVAGDDGVALHADFGVTLTPRLENALHKGVALFFTVEFECTRPRWYWFDERVATVSRTTRVYYHALTRTYRLSTGTLHQSLPSLDEALRVLGRVRHLVVLEPGQLSPETTYVAATRIRLDVSQLPKPFQVSALANREWTLASDWARWEFTTPAGNLRGGGR